jgi:hypothetical protein
MQAIHVGRCVSPIGQLFLLVIHCWNATPSPLSFQQWNVKCPRRMHCKALHLQQSRKLKNWCCSELKSAAAGRNQWGCWLREGVDQGTAVLLQGGQPPPPALHPVQLCCSQSSSGSELQYCLHIYMAKVWFVVLASLVVLPVHEKINFSHWILFILGEEN